jgi:hypothetical protein
MFFNAMSNLLLKDMSNEVGRPVRIELPIQNERLIHQDRFDVSGERL